MMRQRQHPDRFRDADPVDETDETDQAGRTAPRAATGSGQNADTAEMAHRRDAADWSVVGAIQELLNRPEWISTEEARVLLAERAGLVTARDDVIMSACKRYRHRHEGRTRDTEPWGTIPPDPDWTPRPNELACKTDYLGHNGLERARRGERAWLTYTIYRPSVDLLRLNLETDRRRGRAFGAKVAKTPAGDPAEQPVSAEAKPTTPSKSPKRNRRLPGGDAGR